MPAIVYLGPSLNGEEAAGIVDATFRGPVKRGDLSEAQVYDKIVIIDGEFGQELSVSPKEILVLLDSGKIVVGASSMGALRAAELHPYGMLGVGWIYERFRQESVRREDDVALTFSPVDFQPLTVPMVNVEYWVETLEAKRVIDAGTGCRVVRCARGIFFADRSTRRLKATLADVVGRETLNRMLAETGGGIPDVKAMDARCALEFLAADAR